MVHRTYCIERRSGNVERLFFMRILSFFTNWEPAQLAIAAVVHEDFPKPVT